MIYQREIQGLRAVAVTAVVLDHMDVGPFTGGFLGVDVFFVISGYLITGLLLAEHAREQRISLGAFYARRIRRLIPALLVTCMTTVGAGYLTLSNERFERLLDSALAAFASVSNVLFWSEIGYFDAEAASKPLLHTWSLGVEEQFYLVWPLLLTFLLRRCDSRLQRAAWLAAISGLSLLLNLALVHWGLSAAIAADDESVRSWFLDPNATVFYLMPCRVFELGIGAAVAAWTHGTPTQVLPRAADALVVASLCALGYAFVSFDEYHPWLGLLSSSCAAVLIASAASSQLGAWLLGSRPIVWLGGLSYALYLVHWPLVVYFGLLGGERQTLPLLSLFLTMLCLAYLLHTAVERPVGTARFFVSSPSGWRGLVAKLVIPVAVVLCAVSVGVLRDIDDRVPARRTPVKTRHWRRVENRKYCRGSLEGVPERLFPCVNDRGARETIVVWGDSHARHLVAGLSKGFRKSNVAIAYRSSCGAQIGFQGFHDPEISAEKNAECAEHNREVLSWIEQRPTALTVFLSSINRGTPEQVAPINNELVRRLRAAGHTAYVLGDFVGPGTSLADCYAVPDVLISDSRLAELCQPDLQWQREQLRYSAALARLSDHLIAVHDIQCPAGRCSFVDDQGRLVHYDRHHLSILGSAYEVALVMPRIRAAIKQDARSAR